jgi:hypothetical protein
MDSTGSGTVATVTGSRIAATGDIAAVEPKAAEVKAAEPKAAEVKAAEPKAAEPKAAFTGEDEQLVAGCHVCAQYAPIQFGLTVGTGRASKFRAFCVKCAPRTAAEAMCVSDTCSVCGKRARREFLHQLTFPNIAGSPSFARTNCSKQCYDRTTSHAIESQDGMLRASCAMCGIEPDTSPAVPAMRCARCKRSYYCSRACQRRHWPVHKLECAPTAADHAAAPPIRDRKEAAALAGELGIRLVRSNAAGASGDTSATSASTHQPQEAQTPKNTANGAAALTREAP